MPETIFEPLRESHSIQRSLIRKLMRAKPGPDRVALFTALRMELSAHEAAEERFLYVPMLMDDRGLHPSRDALADHHKMDDLVEELQTPDHAGRHWMATVHKLSEELHEHLREEERSFFQLAGKILNDAQKISLARKYRKDYDAMRMKLSATM
ncbi:hemerythrin domain-containing protein [Luteibacter aegosomaticola]|uniref:hemerythrin domain-containing protein n=1 Tax=Luteibacter aegosomaticola TaxID=2911538 RepID=UPI001FFA02DC|nr:hemerythrin domain-containing protein [Luteibacter aegosomaticola]UPG88258.1 hemerythrin domain-containing protein [Luteibacter aegosomaticola]